MYPFKEIEQKWQKKWAEQSSKQDLSKTNNKYIFLVGENMKKGFYFKEFKRNKNEN